MYKTITFLICFTHPLPLTPSFAQAQSSYKMQTISLLSNINNISWVTVIQDTFTVFIGLSFLVAASILIWQSLKPREGKIKLPDKPIGELHTRRESTLASLISHIDSSLQESGVPINEAGFWQGVSATVSVI
jgi:hypothetical protein